MRIHPIICSNPKCRREHKGNSRLCARCYQRQRIYGDPNQRPVRSAAVPQPRPVGPGQLCSPGVGPYACNNPATTRRLVIVGGTGGSQRAGWLHLCADCAEMFDQIEAEPITALPGPPATARLRAAAIA